MWAWLVQLVRQLGACVLGFGLHVLRSSCRLTVMGHGGLMLWLHLMPDPEGSLLIAHY